MNIHIITSSYPSGPDDPSGTAGLFVRQFAMELVSAGHNVIVQPVAKKEEYQADPGIVIVPAPWKGGDRELASMDLLDPRNWPIFLHFFGKGIKNTLEINEAHRIDRMLCMWAVPSGIFGLAAKRRDNTPYDVWALGSDIWKIRRVFFFGKMILRKIMGNADRVFADGMQLCREVEGLSGVPCEFLPSSRKLPPPSEKLRLSGTRHSTHFLFVGRYHRNKGPDLLIKAVACMPQEIRESVRVHMFGLGPMEKELQGMIFKAGLEKYVSLNGPVQAQELSNYLDSVSFLVIPSRIESIPVVFSDALQRGTPVVSTPVGDLRDLIGKFHCGIVADDVSAEGLASALKNAARIDKHAFRDSTAKAYVQFEIKRVVDKWLSLAGA